MRKVNVGKFGEILNGRPDKMSYEEYRAKRKDELGETCIQKSKGSN